MKTFKYTITDPVGIHARPAGLIVKTAQRFQSTITIIKGEKSSDMKKLFTLMGLGVKQGDEITVNIEGADEEDAFLTLDEFIRENL